MCGIAGLLSINKNKSFLTGQIKQMLQSLQHRGPDNEDFFIDENHGLAIGHRRLSILDLSSRGSQPMYSYDKKYLISFNGEIYNHLDLRKNLKIDYNFDQWKSTSDTETLVNYISFYGLNKTLKEIDGMFAISLWDVERKKLILIRDIFGEKPLYFGFGKNIFFFASELNAIIKTNNFNKNINNKGLSSLLEYCYIAAPYSIIKNIYKLGPGESAELSFDQIRNSKNFLNIDSIKKYNWFSIKDLANETNIKNTNISEIKTKIENSVHSRLISDAKLGCFLSGGIDSSLVASIISSYSKEKYETFTIGFEDNEYDESIKAEKIANYLGLKNNKLTLNEKIMRDIVPKLNDIYDEPFADSSQIPTYLLCNFASKFSKVSLSGDGGDELFGGYNRYLYTEKVWNKIKIIPNPIRKNLFKIIYHTPDSLLKFFQLILNKFFLYKQF